MIATRASAGSQLRCSATIFGDDFVVLPRFTPPDFASLQSAFSQSAALVAGDPQAPARWLTQLTHIRPGISRLDAAYSLAQLLGASHADPSALLLGQLPATAGDKWLGLGIDPANPPAKGRVAFACLTGGDPLTQNNYAGLLIDEWPERIPSLQENAAVAFHYEEPKARAPQALLLAVCPGQPGHMGRRPDHRHSAGDAGAGQDSLCRSGQRRRGGPDSARAVFRAEFAGRDHLHQFRHLKEFARVTANLR